MGLSERKPVIGEVSLERMIRAVEKVRNRLLRAATALEQAEVPYAVVGGNVVAAWVARVDESAVRNTQNIDILLRRGDLETAKNALATAGFVYRHVKGVDMFLDGPEAKARDAVHVVCVRRRRHCSNMTRRACKESSRLREHQSRPMSPRCRSLSRPQTTQQVKPSTKEFLDGLLAHSGILVS
jgi:hypothetical protein